MLILPINNTKTTPHSSSYRTHTNTVNMIAMKYKTFTVRARHSRDQNPRPRGQTLNQRTCGTREIHSVRPIGLTRPERRAHTLIINVVEVETG